MQGVGWKNMANKYRYTGEWPPLEVFKKYPNWEYALDEEGVEGQDETTLRPELEQNYITDDTAFTAGRVKQADGTIRDAIIELIDETAYGVDVFINTSTTWRVVKSPSGWIPFDQNWLPEKDRMPVVKLADKSIFPMQVSTILPVKGTGKQVEFTVRN